MTGEPSEAGNKPLRIWLFNPYGPVPGEGWRDYSYVTIGSVLAAAGHEVTWWTSNFSHHSKSFRSKGWEERRLPSGLTLRLVPTNGYRSNVGAGRFLRDAMFGVRAYWRGLKLPRPDVIITSEPATMFGYAGSRLATKTGAALIYDQMDLWPEFLIQMLPTRARRLGEILFWPVFNLRRQMFRRLDGAMALARPYLCSVTKELQGRSIPELVVYNGIDVAAFRRVMQEPLPATLQPHMERHGLRAIFAGSLGNSYDIEAMIGAAELLSASKSDTTIFIAGDGPQRERVETASTHCPNLVYLGKLSPDVLPRVYAHCHVGLACYSAGSNVEMCDKFYDYTAAGLAIVNSLKGEVCDWITEAELGLQYDAGSAVSLANALIAIGADANSTRAAQAASWNIGMRFDRTLQHAQLPAWVGCVARAASHGR